MIFGKRSEVDELLLEVQRVASNSTQTPKAASPKVAPLRGVASGPKDREASKTDQYHDLKRRIFGFLIAIIDVTQLPKMDNDQPCAESTVVITDNSSALKAHRPPPPHTPLVST